MKTPQIEIDKNGAQLITAERVRQLEKEGFDSDNDNRHIMGELVWAAVAYCLDGKSYSAPDYWPWSRTWWKPKSAKENLIRAGALIAAEIDRINRDTEPSKPI